MAYDGLCRTLQNVTVQELALSHFFQLCLDMNFAQPQHCQVQLIEQMEHISSYNYIYIYVYIYIYRKNDELPGCHTPKSYQDLLIRDSDVLSSRPHQSPRQALEVGKSDHMEDKSTDTCAMVRLFHGINMISID